MINRTRSSLLAPSMQTPEPAARLFGDAFAARSSATAGLRNYAGSGAASGNFPANADFFPLGNMLLGDFPRLGEPSPVRTGPRKCRKKAGSKPPYLLRNRPEFSARGLAIRSIPTAQWEPLKSATQLLSPVLTVAFGSRGVSGRSTAISLCVCAPISGPRNSSGLPDPSRTRADIARGLLERDGRCKKRPAQNATEGAIQGEPYPSAGAPRG